MRRFVCLLSLMLSFRAVAQQAAPLPETSKLLKDVENNIRAAEQLRSRYFYRADSVQEDTDGKGRVKKTERIEHEISRRQGVRIDRIVAKNGKPLEGKEKQKEDERIDKLVKEGVAKREKRLAEGKPTSGNGGDYLSVARILELGTFSNERREMFEGHTCIVLDYIGDQHAKTKSRFEDVFKDLAGTIFIDEATRSLVHGEGHFVNNFHIAGGMVANVQKGSHFSFTYTRVNNEIWLPREFSGEGSVRVMLFVHLEGRQRVTFSDYHKYQSSFKISDEMNEVVSDDAPASPVPPQRK